MITIIILLDSMAEWGISPAGLCSVSSQAGCGLLSVVPVVYRFSTGVDGDVFTAAIGSGFALAIGGSRVERHDRSGGLHRPLEFSQIRHV